MKEEAGDRPWRSAQAVCKSRTWYSVPEAVGLGSSLELRGSAWAHAQPGPPTGVPESPGPGRREYAPAGKGPQP